jgi:hypothetical protein
MTTCGGDNLENNSGGGGSFERYCETLLKMLLFPFL